MGRKEDYGTLFSFLFLLIVSWRWSLLYTHTYIYLMGISCLCYSPVFYDGDYLVSV